MKDEATPEQLALARKIVAAYDPDLHRVSTDLENVALRAIQETTRLASIMAADTLDKARAGEIDNDLRAIKHIIIGRFVDDDHLKGPNNG
jgi:hypothetical protein